MIDQSIRETTLGGIELLLLISGYADQIPEKRVRSLRRQPSSLSATAVMGCSQILPHISWTCGAFISFRAPETAESALPCFAFCHRSLLHHSRPRLEAARWRVGRTIGGQSKLLNKPCSRAWRWTSPASDAASRILNGPIGFAKGALPPSLSGSARPSEGSIVGAASRMCGCNCGEGRRRTVMEGV